MKFLIMQGCMMLHDSILFYVVFNALRFLHPLPHKPSWRSVLFLEHREKFTFTISYLLLLCFSLFIQHRSQNNVDCCVIHNITDFGMNSH
jgi:hypothetical protein